MELIANEHMQAITAILHQFPNYHIEGNLMCDIRPDNWICDIYADKIKNVQAIAKDKTKIMEIGVNACHSLLLMLLVNPTAEYVLFDLNIHPYTVPVLEYIKKSFPTKITTIFGDSVQTITQYIQDTSEWNTFDLCHLDGGHTHDIFSVDYENTKRLMKKDGIVIFDDYESPQIHQFLKEKEHEIKEVDAIKTPHHFIYTYV